MFFLLLPLFIFADRKYKCVKPVNKGDDDRSFLTLTTRGHLTATRAHLLSRPFNIWMPNWLGGWTSMEFDTGPIDARRLGVIELCPRANSEYRSTPVRPTAPPVFPATTGGTWLSHTTVRPSCWRWALTGHRAQDEASRQDVESFLRKASECLWPELRWRLVPKFFFV